jgi:predicted PurR-regulated permease PerM
LFPFVTAVLIAIVVDPLLRRFERAGWPRQRSVPLIFCLLILLGVAVLVWAVPILLDQITSIINNFSSYVAQAQKYANHLMKMPAIRRIPPSILDSFDSQLSHAASYIPRSLSSVTGIFLTTVSSVLWMVITLLASFYLMLDLPKIGAGILRTIPVRHRPRLKTIGSEVSGVFANYIRGLFIVCSLYGLAISVVLSVFGIPNALALGLLAGILYMAPYIGPMLTILVIGLIALITYGAAKAALALAVVLVVSQVFDYVVAPRILGHHVGLHPLASLFAMVTAGTLFGVAGVVLAVPVAASIVVVLRNLYPKLAMFKPMHEPPRDDVLASGGD